MQRRQVLATLGTALLSAGCLGAARRIGGSDDTPSPTPGSDFAVSAPTVSPGETGRITLTAESVVHLRFSDVPNGDVNVDYGDASFVPSPTAVWQMRPPTWQWNPPADVDGAVPVSVPDSADPGEYSFTIAIQRDGSDEEIMRTASVRVRE